MKVKFDHTHGMWVEDASLLEVEAIREWESHRWMFENGWLPFKGKWYQTRSSRLKTGEISSKRKKMLSSMKITSYGHASDYIQNAQGNGKFSLKEYEYFMSLENSGCFFMDDALMGVYNIFDDQLFYSVMAYDESKDGKKSYGTHSFYYLIDKFKDKFEYLYIAEYYPIFEYKSKLQGFECWDGQKWTK